MQEKKHKLFYLVLFFTLLLTSCSEKKEMKDGYYTAQEEGYSHGWKEFVTITVQGGKIISAEYNAVNESGFIKSWDNGYMMNMMAETGTYPNEYTRAYAALLVKNQSDGIDAISGASTSAKSFDKLAAAAIEQAKRGDSKTVNVKTEESK